MRQLLESMGSQDDYRRFEKAVHHFLGALDPSARVRFNHKVADRDTGKLRQVDAWIDYTYGGHIPLSIHVSCKNWRRKLDQGHIDTFIANVRSTSASTGVLFCSSGFTRPAVEKAKRHGVAVCRLYRDEPPDLPEVLLLGTVLLCSPRFRLELRAASGVPEDTTWDDVFSIQLRSNSGTETVSHRLDSRFRERQCMAAQQAKSCAVPECWTDEFTIEGQHNQTLRIAVVGYWRFHKARLEAHLINGSYCLSNDSFVGQQSTPSIDMWSSDPGAGWEEVDEPGVLVAPYVMFIRYGGNFAEAAQRQLGGQAVFGGKSAHFTRKLGER